MHAAVDAAIVKTRHAPPSTTRAAMAANSRPGPASLLPSPRLEPLPSTAYIQFSLCHLTIPPYLSPYTLALGTSAVYFSTFPTRIPGQWSLSILA